MNYLPGPMMADQFLTISRALLVDESISDHARGLAVRLMAEVADGDLTNVDDSGATNAAMDELEQAGYLSETPTGWRISDIGRRSSSG